MKTCSYCGKSYEDDSLTTCAYDGQPLGGPPGTGPSAGPMCAYHTSVAAAVLCAKCGTPICGVCAFPSPTGSQVCGQCAVVSARAAVPPVATPLVAAAPRAPQFVPQPHLRCVQHPQLQATARCHTCGAMMCPTCDFALAGGYHLCPSCAANPKTTLSSKRKMLLIWSFVLAVWGTIGMGVLLSGALAGMASDKSGREALGMMLILFLLAPAAAGLALGFSAKDKRLNNPPAVWIAITWNGLIVGSFLLLCVIGNLK